MVLTLVLAVIASPASSTQTTAALHAAAAASGARFAESVFDTVDVTRDIAYGSAIGASGAAETLMLDLYEPAGDTMRSRPAVVYIHGGYFASGDKAEGAEVGNELARHGYVVVSINYRLYPGDLNDLLRLGTGRNAAALDAKAAVRWLRMNAGVRRIDRDAIGAMGYSAGAMTSMDLNYEVYGPGTSGNPGYPSTVDAAVSLSGFESSLRAGAPPVMMFHGDKDTTVPYGWAVKTCADTKAMGNACDLVTYAGLGHNIYDRYADWMPRTVGFFFTNLVPHVVAGWSFEPPAVPSTGDAPSVTLGPPETAALGPWTIEQGGIDLVGVSAAAAKDGTQFVDLNGDGIGPGTISQDVDVAVGHTYTVSFAMSGDPAGDPGVRTVEASFGGHAAPFSFDTTGHTTDDLGWATRSFDVTLPCGASTPRLRFRSLTDGELGPFVDRVSVVDTGALAPGPFTDVSVTDELCPDIDWLSSSGITTGYADGSFQPTAPVTRQSMAAFLFRAAHAGVAPPRCDAPAFPDVPADHPFCGEIGWLAQQEVTGGYADGTFRPTAPVTRQAMAAFLFRIAHPASAPPSCGADGPFPDVAPTHPFCGEITWSAASGITWGYPDGTFRPAQPVTRQAMAAFLHRAHAS